METNNASAEVHTIFDPNASMQAMVLEGTAGKNVIYTLRSPLEKNGIYTGSTILSKVVKALDQSQKNEPEQDWYARVDFFIDDIIPEGAPLKD